MNKLPSAAAFWIAHLFSACISILLSCSLYAQTPILAFNPVITSGLIAPLDIVNAKDGSNRLFIVQKGGTIRYLREGLLKDTVFLDISKLVSSASERGLLSLAFHPAYQSNGYFFVYYTDLNGDLTVARYQVSSDPNRADSLTGQVIISIPHRTESNHNGGKLNFGSDGHLYFATGDGGSGGDPNFIAQKLDTLLGKMIRINVNNFAVSAPYYTIPADNPYTAPGDNIKDEIWASGLRNPFRWSFDRLTQDMWIGDVGQGAREEINFLAAGTTGGKNYGWRCYEGNLTFNDSACLPAANYVFPVFDYGRSNVNGGQTVTGGYVYRGAAYPQLYGWYICIDFYSTNGWLIRSNGGGWNVQQQSGLPVNIAGFGEDESGELFAASVSNGTIYRVTVSGTLPVKLQGFNAIARNGMHEIQWQTSFEQHVDHYEVQLSRDGINFNPIGEVNPANTNSKYRFNYKPAYGGTLYYRLKIVDKDGRAAYSSVFKFEENGADVLIANTLIRNNTISVQLNRPFDQLQLIDMSGRVIKSRSLGSVTGLIYLDVPEITKGIYLLRLSGKGADVVRKITIP